MAMPLSLPFRNRKIWTVDDLERLPDDTNRYEILHGELLVTPMAANGHQGVASRLVRMLGSWCDAHTGWAIRAPGGVYMSQTTWLEPDIAVYPVSDFSELDWRDMPTPLLVIEVASPSTRKRDRHRKRPAYLAHGVREVWTIDRRTRIIERWTSASEFPETHQASITWTPDAKYPTLTVPEAKLFGP